MPIEQPTEFELLNRSEDRKTSSLAILRSLFATADEVIQCLFPQCRMSAFGTKRT
jgi:hypothetical protein